MRARSGLALRHGIGLANGPGTIDSDYRGEVGVILVNWGTERFTVAPGDRVAQLVIQQLPAGAHGLGGGAARSPSAAEGGFGHTGSAAGDGGAMRPAYPRVMAPRVAGSWPPA